MIRFSHAIVICLLTLSFSIGAEKKSESTHKVHKTDSQTQKELKLDDLFPEKSVFGPSASSTSFSHDGRYGAWLYRPRAERRHGNDLYLLETQTGKVRRVTSASVMAKFQEKARKVVEDRIAKAKAADKKADKGDEETQSGLKKEKKVEKKSENKPDELSVDSENAGQAAAAGQAGETPKKKRSKKSKGKQNKESQKDDIQARKERGDWVDEKDAEAKDAPRYDGIRSYAFSPKDNRILIVSGGDIYLYTPEKDKLERLTQTREAETNVAWLEDGSGYTYMASSALMMAKFDCQLVQQIDPKFPDGYSSREYEISPDGKYIAFITGKEIQPGKSSKVDIANYKTRLMQAREVSRHVSDDEQGVNDLRVYLYQISQSGLEDGKLVQVYSTRTNLPSDLLGHMSWSTDSQHVAFMEFDEDTRLVRFFEAGTEVLATDKDSKASKSEKKDDAASQARTIYSFLHTGGPSTPGMMALYYLADNKTLVYLSEQSGFRNLNKLDPLYEHFTPLVDGSFEIYPFDISKDRQWIYVSSTKEHPSRLDIYKVSTETGEMVRLTHQRGVYKNPAVSDDGRWVLANLASYQKLNELVFIKAQQDKERTLTDSHSEKAKAFIEPQPTFFDYPNRHGHTIYGQMFLPDGWKKTDKRPLLIYFYGGPLGTRKQVVEANYYGSAYAFAWYMAKKHGYVTCTIDPRGNSGYAGVFEKANFGKVGQPQVEDLVDGAKFMAANYGVDPKRIAIHGWSFGGFQTQMCLYTEPDVFAAGIAGAGPTEWENYNSWYTTRTIGISKPHEKTLEKFSLLPLAKNLKAKLLLVHGMEDSNVLLQDTINVYRELLKAGKETLVELFLDPTGGHGLGGDVKTLSRYRKYEDFLLRVIGSGQPKAAAKEQVKPAKKKRSPKKKATRKKREAQQKV